MTSTHTYRVTVRWTGDLGEGTREYRAYSRDHVVESDGRPSVPLTSGLSPRSDARRYTPDDLLVAALSSCHMLWYLHLCSTAGVIVRSYRDDAEGVLEIGPDGGGRMTSATLRPTVGIEAGSLETARALHDEAHHRCFVANSVRFPVACEPTVQRVPDPAAVPG